MIRLVDDVPALSTMGEILDSLPSSQEFDSEEDWSTVAKISWAICQLAKKFHLDCSDSFGETVPGECMPLLERFMVFASHVLQREDLESDIVAMKELLAECESIRFAEGLPKFSSSKHEAIFKLLKTRANCEVRLCGLQGLIASNEAENEIEVKVATTSGWDS